jgi:hypothetical protein
VGYASRGPDQRSGIAGGLSSRQRLARERMTGALGRRRVKSQTARSGCAAAAAKCRLDDRDGPALICVRDRCLTRRSPGCRAGDRDGTGLNSRDLLHSYDCTDSDSAAGGSLRMLLLPSPGVRDFRFRVRASEVRSAVTRTPSRGSETTGRRAADAGSVAAGRAAVAASGGPGPSTFTLTDHGRPGRQLGRNKGVSNLSAYGLRPSQVLLSDGPRSSFRRVMGLG